MRPRERGSAQDVRATPALSALRKMGTSSPSTNSPVRHRSHWLPEGPGLVVLLLRNHAVAVLNLDFQEPRQCIRQDECACEFRFAFSTFRVGWLSRPFRRLDQPNHLLGLDQRGNTNADKDEGACGIPVARRNLGSLRPHKSVQSQRRCHAEQKCNDDRWRQLGQSVIGNCPDADGRHAAADKRDMRAAPSMNRPR